VREHGRIWHHFRLKPRNRETSDTSTALGLRTAQSSDIRQLSSLSFFLFFYFCSPVTRNLAERNCRLASDVAWRNMAMFDLCFRGLHGMKISSSEECTCAIWIKEESQRMKVKKGYLRCKSMRLQSLCDRCREFFTQTSIIRGDNAVTRPALSGRIDGAIFQGNFEDKRDMPHGMISRNVLRFL